MADLTSPEDEAFFAAIGRLVASWAHLELALDEMVKIMHSLYGHRVDADCGFPEHVDDLLRCGLSRKIEYLRKVFGQTPLPQDAIEGFQSYLHEVSSEWERRHDIIHAPVIHYVEGSGEARMARLKKRKGKLLPNYFKKTTEDILKAAIRANKMSGKTFMFAEEITEIIRSIVANDRCWSRRKKSAISSESIHG